MAKLIIPIFKTFMYLEVFKILQIKDDCIYKTESTNKFIKNEDENLLNINYKGVSIYVTLEELNNKGTIELSLFDLNNQ